MISLEDLVLQSRGVTLGPLSLAIDEGIVGVVGASGAGKTLLLLALAGLLPHTIQKGRARVSFPVAMVFANDALDDGRTALGNVVDAAEAAGVGDAVGAARALLSRVGLDPITQNRVPRGLSGGQRKRVGIARALIVKPRTLLLDDATAGLDPITARAIVELIREESRGAAVLFATQDVDTVLPHLRRALFLKDGAGEVVDVAALPAPFAPVPYEAFL